MRHTLRTLLLCAVALCSLGASAAQFMNDIVAVVNDRVIVRSELDREIERVLYDLRQRGTEVPPREILERQVLEQLVMEHLQLQLAELSGIRIEDNEVTEALRNIADRNGLSLAEFRQALQSEGADFELFREKVHRELIISSLRQRDVLNRVSVSDREVDQYLAAQAAQGSERQRYLLGHILVALPEDATPGQVAQAESRLARIQERLAEGSSFRSTAVALSDGQLALQGGELGWRELGQLPELFAAALAGLGPGDVSEVVRSSSGYHLLKVYDVEGNSHRVVDQTHARHILIRITDALNTQDALERIRRLRERILTGESFAELASAHSDDGGSALKGGDLGWINPGELVPAFEEAMNGLEVGVVSRPVRTQYGWHIIEVLERRRHDETGNQQREAVRREIQLRKAEERLERWLRQMRDEAYIDIRV